jgi:rhodanese-related sulfurtransferase
MDEPSRFSFSGRSAEGPALPPAALYARIGHAAAPILLDVRPLPQFDKAATLIVGAMRRAPEAIGAWHQKLPRGRLVVAYCNDGHAASSRVAAELRQHGLDAIYLDGGIEAWAAAGLPQRRREPAPRAWVTRERPKIDRIACPWLIRRFIDPEAALLYVPLAEVAETASRTGGIAYDVADAQFGHHGERCSFDAFLRIFAISDRALDRLAPIVRGADTGKPELTPQSAGLLAISHGLSANFRDDHAMLEEGMVMYDALYAWCRLQDGAGQ